MTKNLIINDRLSKKTIILNLISRIKTEVPDPNQATTKQLEEASKKIINYIHVNMSHEEKQLIGVLLILDREKFANKELIQIAQ